MLGNVGRKLRLPHLYSFTKYLNANKEFLAPGIVMLTISRINTSYVGGKARGRKEKKRMKRQTKINLKLARKGKTQREAPNMKTKK